MNHVRNDIHRYWLFQSSFSRLFARRLIHALMLLTLGVTSLAFALPSDREKPIRISSDSAEIDDSKGISIYRGNVVVTQGSTKLMGDVVTVYTKEHHVVKVISRGGVGNAYFEEAQDNEKGLLKAWGKTIQYDVDAEQVELIKQARLEQNGDIFTGDRIEYSKLKQVVNAEAATGDQKGGRVEMIIQPRQSEGRLP